MFLARPGAAGTDVPYPARPWGLAIAAFFRSCFFGNRKLPMIRHFYCHGCLAVIYCSIVKFRFFLILPFFVSLPGFSQSQAGLSITLEENNGTLTIVRCKGFAKEVVIPEVINDMPVTAIGDYAFAKKDLTKVTIPDSITVIGKGAFAENKLTELVIGDNVRSLGVGAFANNQLVRISIGAGLTVISRGCFQVNLLRSVELPDTLTAIEDYAFFGNRLTGVSIPTSITAIGEGAFAGNRITVLTIGDGVETIGDGAFFNNELNRITIPPGLEEVGKRAFNNRPKGDSFSTRVNYYDTHENLLFSSDSSFDTYYNSQGRRSGTYIYTEGTWSIGE
jgi:hypothetical protein